MAQTLQPFADISRSQQRRRLAASAEQALVGFGIKNATIKLIHFDFNATYRVVLANGTRLALRLNVNSPRDLNAVKAEAAWVSALSDVDGIKVPTPQKTTAGHVVHEVSCAGLDRRVPAVLYSWLDGPDLGEQASLRKLAAKGELAARLHEHAHSWKLPKSISFISMDRVMMDEPDTLTTLDAPWFNRSKPVILEALNAVKQNAAPVFRGDAAIPIHADLHVWNTKWVDGEIAVFDFDDAGLGRELQDLSVSAYYLRDRPKAEAAFLAGYERYRPLPTHKPEHWEALVAGRNLVLLNAVANMVTAGYEDFLPGYVKRTEARLKHYLKTGLYSMDVD